MKLDRRDFMKASAALGGAIVLKSTVLLPEAMSAIGPEAPPVIWLQGQSCTGCSVSFLNSIYYTTPEDLLLNQLDVRFQSNVMAAAGDMAVEAAVSTQATPGYVLILEGAIPFGANGEYCHLWENTSMVDVLQQFAPNAGVIIALGTCACYGGMYAAMPNPTNTMGVEEALSQLGINKSVINIPGCPAHPDWLVGTVATLLNGQMPALDAYNRPIDYYGETVHDDCPNLSHYLTAYAPRMGHARDQSCLSCHSPSSDDVSDPKVLGMAGCLFALNCKGRLTSGDCSTRKWNSGAAGEYGEEWCVGAGAPCIGCTEPNFPDGMTPFYVGQNGSGGGDDDHPDDDHHDGGGDDDNGTTTDTVRITRAIFESRRNQLTVEATSSRQPNAVLDVVGYGRMEWDSRKNQYRYKNRGVSDPGGAVSVVSSLGGSDTATVQYGRGKDR